MKIEPESDDGLWSKDIEDRFFSYRPGSESYITRGDDDYFAFRGKLIRLVVSVNQRFVHVVWLNACNYVCHSYIDRILKVL